MRFAIEISNDQHQRLKTVAAFRGQSIMDYVLEHLIPESLLDEERAPELLESFLQTRIDNQHDVLVYKSVRQIFEESYQD